MDYYGTVFGKLRIPCHVFVESPGHKGLKLEQIKIDWNPTLFELPAELLDKKDAIVKKKAEESKAKGVPFYDGDLVRVFDYGFSDEDENRPIVTLYEQPSKWTTFLASNLSLDYMSPTEKELFAKPFSLNDSLANPAGVSTLVINKENEMVYVQRSDKVATYKNFFHDLTAGYMDPKKDMLDGKPHPFMTAKREMQEEAGMDFDLNDYKLLSIGRDSNDFHVEIFGELRTDLTYDEILSTPKKSKFETLSIKRVEFTPEKVIPLLKGYANRTDCKPVDWVPAGAVNILQSLMGEYGYARVKRAVDELV